MANQIVISSGAKVRNLNGVLTGTTGVVNSLGINVANGIPQLDGSGKILVSQLPNSVMEYKGTWNAATNTPTLANGTGNQGDVYLCSTAGTVNFGAGAITFAVGDQVIYSGTIWQKAGGSTGTVTSIAVTESGDALTITGSPITTSGTINIGFAGTTGQYVNGAGGLTTFPTLLSSVGLSMPSAFTVTNSPLTANGTISVTGAGTTAQYVRGDGSLATFPSTSQESKRLITEVYNSTGATLTKGTIVYINGGQGNLPTVTKAIATGDSTSAQTYGVVQSDITNNNNGFVVVIGSLTDLDTQTYAAGTQLYLSGTTAGTWTSTKPSAPIHLVYVGIVVRSHPTQGVVEIKIQNGYELDELHDVAISSVANNDGIFYNSSNDLWENKTIAEVLGYTPQAQLTLTTTGTSGAATLTGATLNIPNYTTDLSGYVPYTGATNNVNLGENDLFVRNISNKQLIKIEGYVSGPSTLAGALAIKTSSSGFSYGGTGFISVTSNDTNALTIVNESGLWSKISFNSISANRTFTLPNASGTIALTSDIPSVAGVYLPLAGGTLTGALNINLSGSTGLNVASDGVVFRSNTGIGSPRQIVLSSGGGPTALIEAKGYGANYNTDLSIKTYNSSGTGFDVFFATSAGNVGIGTTAPLSKLHVAGTGTVVRFGEESGTTGKQLLFGINASTGTSEIQSVWQGTSNTILALNPAGGNVGIGTDSIANGTTFGGGGQINRLKISSGSYPCFEINSTGDGGGSIQFTHGTNAPNQVRALIAYNSAAGGVLDFVLSNIANGPMIFATNNTERMRITGGGTVFIGGTLGIGGRFIVFNDSNTGINIMDSSNNGQLMRFHNSGAVQIGGITTNGSSTSFNTTSDYRLKQDFKDYNGLGLVSLIKTYDYEWKNSNSRMHGVIAHELAEVIPYAVNGKKDGEQMQGVDYSKLVPVLVKAIQELKAEIDELKNK